MPARTIRSEQRHNSDTKGSCKRLEGDMLTKVEHRMSPCLLGSAHHEKWYVSCNQLIAKSMPLTEPQYLSQSQL
jgi:hypothetical protein